MVMWEMQEMQVHSLGQEHPLKIPRTGKPGVLQSMGSQRVGHDLVTEQHILADCLWAFTFVLLCGCRVPRTVQWISDCSPYL